MFRPWRTLALAAVACLAIAATASVSEARSGHGGWDATPVPATAVVDWNATALATVRGALPAKFRSRASSTCPTSQAAVYDAVTKIAGRYEPYHDFHEPRLAARSARCPPPSRRRPTPRSPTTSRRNRRPCRRLTRRTWQGCPAKARPRESRSGRRRPTTSSPSVRATGRDAVITTPYGAGPLTPGVWIFAPPPSLQSAQTPWLAFMRPLRCSRRGSSASARRPAS